MPESQLLTLTPLSLDDKDIFVAVYTDVTVMEFIGECFNKDQALTMFDKSLLQWKKKQPSYLFYLIKYKHSNIKLGVVGLLWNQKSSTTVEMGVMIQKNKLRMGYGLKAMDLLMKHAFYNMELKSILGFCNKDNIMVNRVSEGLGCKNIGTTFDLKSRQTKIIWEITNEQYKKTR